MQLPASDARAKTLGQKNQGRADLGAIAGDDGYPLLYAYSGAPMSYTLLDA